MLGSNSAGAQDDLQRATELAIQKLLSFGMSPNVGMLAFHPEEVKRGGRMYAHYSETTQKLAEQDAAKLVEAAYELAKEICEQNKDKLKALGDELAEKKELTTPDMERLWGKRPEEPSNDAIMNKFYRALGISPVDGESAHVKHAAM